MSRIQSITQLYILERSSLNKHKNNYNDGDQIPTNMIWPWPEAINELERLKSIDIGPSILSQPSGSFKVISLNNVSLAKHISDIQADPDIMSSNVVLLQEFSFAGDMMPDFGYELGPNYIKEFNSRGWRKGLASYFPPNFYFVGSHNYDSFQTTTFGSENLFITNVYRSQYSCSDFCIELQKLLTNMQDLNHLILGDFNYCLRNESDHEIKKIFENNGYHTSNSLLHIPPESTHMKGRCIDHIWVKFITQNIRIENYAIKTCIYSDHEKIEISLTM